MEIIKDNIRKDIIQFKNDKRVIIAVGAAAKGNTFLNYCNLDNTLINYVTDSSQYKIGKYTPGSRILIMNDSVISEYENPVIIILSWNIEHILKPKLLELNKNITFLDISSYFNV